MPATSESSTRSARTPDAFSWLLATALAVSACVGPQPKAEPVGTSSTQGAAKSATHPSGSSGHGGATADEAGPPRAALETFLAAAEKEDFGACYQLLAGPLRERYTPARLADDFKAARGTAQDKLARARAALAQAPRLETGRAEFPISEGKAVRLVFDSGSWKVAALE